MDIAVYIASLAAGGLLVGALGRLAVPGKDPIGLAATLGIGILASLIGGLILGVFAGPDGYPYGIPVSVLCATGIVYLIRRRRGGTFTRAAPGERPPGPR